jgi:hypothetical protein
MNCKTCNAAILAGAYCPTCAAAMQTPIVPPVKPYRQRPTRPFKILRKIKLSTMQKQLRTVLARDIDRLMEASFTRKLERDESVSLRGYVELVNELEELEKIKLLEDKDKGKK